jgi:hypothetical protein
MARCIYCRSDTYLFSNGVPICIPCTNDLDAGRNPEFRELAARPQYRASTRKYPVKVKLIKPEP